MYISKPHSYYGSRMPYLHAKEALDLEVAFVHEESLR